MLDDLIIGPDGVLPAEFTEDTTVIYGVDEDGNPILELKIPTPNGSTMLMRYRQTDTKTIRVDHLTTHSVFAPRADFRQENLQVATDKINYKDMGKALPPNAIHAADAALLSFLVDDLDGDVPFSLIHDSIGIAPCKYMDDLMVQFREALIKTTTGNYLEGILEANGLDPVDLPVPNFGTFEPEELRGAKYPLC